MSDLLRRSDVLDILGNVFATTLNVDVDVAIAAMMSKIKYMPKVESDDTTEAYNKGLNDVWEFVRKLTTLVGDGGMSAQEWESIYKTKTDRIIDEYTPQEALAKLEAYEKEQAERVKVGDVVKIIGTEAEYVVTKIDTHHCVNYFGGIDKSGKWFIQSNVKKTGKHIDIQSALEQIAE